MYEYKKCPICFADSKAHPANCERERCAWWNEKTQQCAMLTIAQKMGGDKK